MKPANDPNRQQQPPTQIRPPATNVRTTTGPVTSHSVVTTNVTSHIVSTGNPSLPAIKTIPVTASRVVSHTSATTLTLVGSGTTGLRPVTASPGITTFRPATIANISGPRGAVATPMMRNIVTTPIMTPAGSGTPGFVSGIRAMPRAPGLTTVTSAVQSTWAGKTVATTPTKITTSMPTYPGGQGPRPTGSLTVTTRPMVSSTAARPELATLRTTKPAATPDKFIRAPTRATLAFASPGQAGTQFQAGTHLAVAPMPTNQTSSTALTLQPIVVGTSNTAKTVGAPRQTALHPIGPKVITQPAHGPIQITHLAGVSGKPGAPGTSTGALQLARGPVPQASGGAFTAATGGAQLKVLTQAPGAILTDVLQQQGGTTLIPSGSVFIQAGQHTTVNVTPLERGTVVTSANYTTLPSYFYDASGGGGSLITSGPPHQSISHGGTQHQLIRTFPPTSTQGGVTTMQVQAGTFQPADDSARKTFSASNVTNTGVGTMVGARFNPVMVMETSSRQPMSTPTSQSEGTSEQQSQSGASSHSTVVSQSQSTQQSHPHQQSSQQQQQILQTVSSANSQPSSSHSSMAPALLSMSLPSTPSTTPSKFSASPRPSILRKREHDGTPSKVQKNLLAALSSVASMSSSLPSSTASSPPPSPPARPDSRDGNKDGNGHSSAGSSTISATSSPGIPCDGDNNGNSQSGMPLKPEPADLAEVSSNNGTNGNSDAMSPRKKPRKQQLTGNELQEPPYSDENVEFAEDKIKKEGHEANHKSGQDGSVAGTPSRGGAATVSARRRPSVSLLQTYRTCWKPRNNHFLRPTDVRPREERRPTVAELSSQKMVMQRAQGWKLHHLSTQMEEMAEREMDVLGQLSDVLDVMESPKTGVEPSSKDLNRTNELIRSNVQRSKVVRDQLEEVRVQLLRLLEHTSPVIDIIKRNANRRQAKKKY